MAEAWGVEISPSQGSKNRHRKKHLCKTAGFAGGFMSVQVHGIQERRSPNVVYNLSGQVGIVARPGHDVGM